MENLGIKLKEEEKKEVLKRVDKEETGTVEYDNYQQVVYEILQAMDAKKVAEEKLEEQRE